MDASDQNRILPLANQLGELETIREYITMLMKTWSIYPTYEFTLNMYLEEAFTNVIKHAIDDNREHEIELNS